MLLTIPSVCNVFDFVDHMFSETSHHRDTDNLLPIVVIQLGQIIISTKTNRCLLAVLTFISQITILYLLLLDHIS